MVPGVGGKDESIPNPLSERLQVHVCKPLRRRGGLGRLLVRRARLGRRAYVPKVHAEPVGLLGHRLRGAPAPRERAAWSPLL